MISFQLKKPLYEWRLVNPGDHQMGSDLYLADEIKDWLEERSIAYDTHVEREETEHMPQGRGIYLFFYIDIEDADAAMLFKLTWM